jgi:GrpB-like predicted nucleotidyltransferase (UPF0157 family)
MVERYVIVDHEARWAEEFAMFAARICAGLGGSALRVDHIGSTSVAGLCAKDVIDIQVTVADVEEMGLVEAMEQAGFVYRPMIVRDHAPAGYGGEAGEWEKRYFREGAGEREVHVHMREAGRTNQRYALLFRDYLRAHPPAAQAYGEVKLRLAPKLEREDYVEVKDSVCDLVMQAAEMWALASGWGGA